MNVPNLGLHIIISLFLSALYLVSGEYLIGLMAASFAGGGLIALFAARALKY
tara:strand:+ start:302 stop:457 length:156 start_codon:yes stop_codon:yes gene_type:complete